MKNWPEKLGYGFLIIVLAIYPVYTNLVYGYAEYQLIRHLKFINHDSYFFNPWQYRILAPYLIEGIAIPLKQIFKGTISEHSLYFSIFKILRFCQHLVIFGLAAKFYRHFTSSRLLIFLTLPVMAAAMGAATLKSDFSFNNYFDIIFYLAALTLIFSESDIRWFLPLTFLAALNRETSLLLPFLLFLNYKEFFAGAHRKKYWTVLLSCLVIFALVFVGVRFYFGYRPPTYIGMATGWPMLKFNLTDPLTILELLATLSILPIFSLLHIGKAEMRLQLLFWLLVPAWFAIHFWLVWARETRIFLVPLIVVFLPVCLDLVQRSLQKTGPESSDAKN